MTGASAAGPELRRGWQVHRPLWSAAYLALAAAAAVAVVFVVAYRPHVPLFARVLVAVSGALALVDLAETVTARDWVPGDRWHYPRRSGDDFPCDPSCPCQLDRPERAQ